MDDNNQNQIEELDENHLIQVRKEKLKALIEAGKNPYEITEFNRSHVTTEIFENYEELEGKEVAIAGRIMGKRIMGKASLLEISLVLEDLCLKQRQVKYQFMLKKLHCFLNH